MYSKSESVHIDLIWPFSVAFTTQFNSLYNQIHGIDAQQIVWINTHFNRTQFLKQKTEHTQWWKFAHGNSYLKAESVIFFSVCRITSDLFLYLTVDIFSHSVTEREHALVESENIDAREYRRLFCEWLNTFLYIRSLNFRRQIYGK